MAKDWQDVKSSIHHFYVVQGLQLDEVIRRVAADSDFSASPRQYLSKLSEWGYDQSTQRSGSSSQGTQTPMIYGRHELNLLSESFHLGGQDHCARHRSRRQHSGICKSCNSTSPRPPRLRKCPTSGLGAIHATPGAVMSGNPLRSGSSDDYAWTHGGSTSSYHDDSASDSGTGVCRQLEDISLRESDQSSVASSSGHQQYHLSSSLHRPQPPHASSHDEEYGGWI